MSKEIIEQLKNSIEESQDVEIDFFYQFANLMPLFSKKDKKIIKAFQLRFLPERVTGNLDQKTLKISYYLAANYKILKKP